MARLKKEHGSVMENERDRRLGWTDLEAKGEAFEDAGICFTSIRVDSWLRDSCLVFFLT